MNTQKVSTRYHMPTETGIEWYTNEFSISPRTPSLTTRRRVSKIGDRRSRSQRIYSRKHSRPTIRILQGVAFGPAFVPPMD